MKSKISVTIEEGLRNRVAELASVEQRSFSQMLEVLVQRGLDGARFAASTESFTGPVGHARFSGLADSSFKVEPGVAAGPGIGGSGATGAETVTAADAPPGSPSKPRSKMCEHRVPPGAWCKWCDA